MDTITTYREKQKAENYPLTSVVLMFFGLSVAG
jgi:hypothetical protein